MYKITIFNYRNFKIITNLNTFEFKGIVKIIKLNTHENKYNYSI